MRIVLINSSGRSNGNTERLLKVLESQLTKTAEGQHIALEVSHVILSRQDVKVCRGCRCCFEQNGCPLKDEASKVEELLSAVLILASPVYLEDVNGIMKNWLDRMAFNCHRPAFYGKYAVTITTSGAKASNHSLNTIKNALTAWGIHVLSANNFRMGAYMDDERITEQYISKLSDIATNIIGAFQKDAAQNLHCFRLFHLAFSRNIIDAVTMLVR